MGRENRTSYWVKPCLCNGFWTALEKVRLSETYLHESTWCKLTFPGTYPYQDSVIINGPSKSRANMKILSSRINVSLLEKKHNPPSIFHKTLSAKNYLCKLIRGKQITRGTPPWSWSIVEKWTIFPSAFRAEEIDPSCSKMAICREYLERGSCMASGWTRWPSRPLSTLWWFYDLLTTVAAGVTLQIWGWTAAFSCSRAAPRQC